MPDQPWLMRTYAGHTSARASNDLYRENLAKGQTGLSVAFDLPTQCGYDPDHPLARGEVGKVGVPIASIEDMEALFAGIPLERMNTSMTINATAPWLLALYVALAERRGIAPAALQGTTQNDILKEYLSRGTYIFPPAPSLRLTKDTIVYTVANVPRFNPINVCSYHLQEAGATPVEEVAYALAAAVAVLDAVRASGEVAPAEFGRVFGRISFFLNSGVRFIEERTAAIAREAKAELERVLALGGAIPAVETGYMKARLVRSNAARLKRIEAGEQVVVGVNRFTETAESPLTGGGVDGRILKVDPAAEREQIERVRSFRARRDEAAVREALEALREAARSGENIMPPSIRCAHAGVTTGEWAGALRAEFGEYRAPTGLGGEAPAAPSDGGRLRAAVEAAAKRVGRRPRLLVAKPGLDGHSNGAEQIALRARDGGMEVIYQGIRLTPEEIARAAEDEDVDAVGVSILSGSHLEIVPAILRLLAEAGLGNLPVFAGGIIPPEDAEKLRAAGVRRVFTPKDFSLDAALVEVAAAIGGPPPSPRPHPPAPRRTPGGAAGGEPKAP